MARKRSGRRPRKSLSRMTSVQRKISVFSRYSDLLDKYINPELQFTYGPDPLQDRRTFHPARDHEIYDLYGKPATYKVSDPKRPAKFYDPTTARISFSYPQRIKECLRRKMRREVLFANRKTGKGSGSPKRMTPLSLIKC